MDLIDRLAEDPAQAGLFFDVDGVLAPIVARPQDARVPDDTGVERLARDAGYVCLVGELGLAPAETKEHLDGVLAVAVRERQLAAEVRGAATFDQLLPLPASETQVAKHDWDYLYEPDAQAVLEHVLTRYIESLVYQAVLENVASEHAARMVAMKAASDNATKLIGTLQLIYNKARQAAITQEISEIVGGAAAV